MVTTTTQYSFQKPTVGDDEDAWGGYLNSNFDSIDSLLRGATSLSSLSLTGNITFGDNDKAIFGAGSDLQIYHDGGHSYISDQGTGNLHIIASNETYIANAGNSEYIARFITDGAVELYYDAVKKFETTSTGIDVTGTVTTDGLTVSGAATFTGQISGTGQKGILLGTHGRVYEYESGSTHDLWFYNSYATNGLVIRTDGSLKFYDTDYRDIWHSGNDGSGSGLDADLLDGYHASTGSTTSSSANTIVLRNWGGDIYARYMHSNYLYMDHGAATRSSDTIFYSSTDNYLRKNNATGFKNSLGLGTGDSPTFSTVTADGLSVALNTDAYATIGRAHVGYMGWSDWAGFSHIDSDGQYSYALLQNPSGQTIVNAASGQSVSVNIANSNVAQWTSSYSSLQVPLYNYSIFYEDYDALSGTSVTVNTDTAQGFSLTLSGNTTFTFNSVASAWSYGFVLELSGHASSTYTVTWPTSVDWAGGTAPDAPAAGETDIYVFWTRDGGTTWYGVHSIDAAS